MIHLNLATDYALRTLLYLAARPHRRSSVREIAAFYTISADHVSKVAQSLTQAGFTRADRGRTGGLLLARLPVEITVGEVVELFEGPVALLQCVDTSDVCIIQAGCRLRHVLARAGRNLMAELRRVTLDELVRTSPSMELIQLSADRATAGAAAGGAAPETDGPPLAAEPAHDPERNCR